MTAELESRHAGLAFNVLPPGSEGVALPDAIGLQSWSGTLPADGEYTIRTYLPRSAARRGERANYKLTASVTGPSTAAASSLPDAVARASRGQFNATGQIPCAQAFGQPMGQCPFGVARAGGGTAVLVVTLPDGRKRSLHFEKGQATAADLSQTDGNVKFSATKRADLFMIDAGNERYEVPEAAIFGG